MVSPSEPEPRYLLTVRKWDVVDTLRREHGLTSIVLILTPSTGPDMHGRPELAHFLSATTLTYASDEQRSQLDDARQLAGFDAVVAWCRQHRPVTELVFIDCWHTYADSVGALELALQMLPNGGHIVMHDCDPPGVDVAGDPLADCRMLWCGESWRAFVDVTAALPAGSDWFVVESDLGIGVIRVPPVGRNLWRGKRSAPRTRLVPAGYQAGWDWLVEHRTEALRPMSIADWQHHANGVSDTSNHYNP